VPPVGGYGVDAVLLASLGEELSGLPAEAVAAVLEARRAVRVRAVARALRVLSRARSHTRESGHDAAPWIY
jgi:hypothetical protein